jgi:hypothetical protein
MSSVTALPKVKRPVDRKRTPKDAPAPAPEPEHVDTLETAIPACLETAPDPQSCLTHEFSADALFGDIVDTSTLSPAFEKKNTLRKLMDMTTTDKPEALSREARTAIIRETERLVRHITVGTDAFISLFAKVTAVRDTRLLSDLYYTCTPLLLDYTVSAHPRLQQFGMFNVAFLIENGKLLARLAINSQAMHLKWRKHGADNRYRALVDAAAGYLARQPLGIHVLRAGVPTAWHLHADTNTPLTERQIEEQNIRINGEFVFLCAGLLHEMRMEAHAIAMIHRILIENGI